MGIGKNLTIQYVSPILGSRYDCITIYCDVIHIAIYCDIKQNLQIYFVELKIQLAVYHLGSLIICMYITLY